VITFFAAILVLASVGIVAWPMLRRTGSKSVPGLTTDNEVSELLAQKDNVLFAINELESDYETGSLSKGDYHELREKYEEKAVRLIKTMDELKNARGFTEEISPVNEEIEAEVVRLRRTKKAARDVNSCPGCRAAVAADALFCHRCGKALSANCPICEAKVRPEDRFCVRCGAAVNASPKRGKAG
jgi:hypothetical protein